MIMSKLFFYLLFILPGGHLLAQARISGIVKDTRNHPLAGASITIKDSYDGAVTDSTGNFSFKTTEKGEHVIQVSAVGFKGLEEKINLSGTDQSLSFSLKEEI